jgi:ribosomal protein L34
MFETREELLRHLVIYDLLRSSIKNKVKLIIMTKRTLSNKSRYSVLKVSGFRARMSTPKVVIQYVIAEKRPKKFSNS